jgi:hypothetical protein
VATNEAFRAFLSAGFTVTRENNCWRVHKMLKGQDRFLSDAELILLAKSFRHAARAG